MWRWNPNPPEHINLSQAFFSSSQNHPDSITIPKGRILRGRSECSVCLSFFLWVGIDREPHADNMLGELVRLK